MASLFSLVTAQTVFIFLPTLTACTKFETPHLEHNNFFALSFFPSVFNKVPS